MPEENVWIAMRDGVRLAATMYGTSSSGFNSFQVAMEQPSASKAIIAIFATEDRYTDDVHYGRDACRALDLVVRVPAREDSDRARDAGPNHLRHPVLLGRTGGASRGP